MRRWIARATFASIPARHRIAEGDPIMRVYSDASESIGNTPLVELRKLAKGLKARVFGKV